VKPSNLLVDGRGGVRVADFGLAQVPAVPRRAEDGLIGTAAYMAPEQLFGAARQVVPACDIFSLGAVLYALLAGQPPYDGQTTLDVLERRLAGSQPAGLRSLRPDVPERVAGVVARCLAHEPSERFATAEELVSALRSANREN
jgi:serine/threonine-protein kinase